MEEENDDAPGTPTTGEERRPRGGGGADRSKGWGDRGTFGSPRDEKKEPKQEESPADNT